MLKIKPTSSAERKRLRNRSVRSALKSHITKTKKLIANKELEPAQEALTATISTLDKTAQKGIIHPNKAARHKSRLTKKLNQILIPR